MENRFSMLPWFSVEYLVLLHLLLLLLLAVTQEAGAWTVSCSNPYSTCYGMLKICPQSCSQWCKVDCNSCLPQCTCDLPGAVCQDPRFIGGDGTMFYFHGEKDADFCIVSDPGFHINAHFIGKRGKGMTRDFTWVQSLGILVGSHRIFVGANKVASWDNHVDAISVSVDGTPISLPPRESASWLLPGTGIKIFRIIGKNALSIEVEGQMKLTAHAVAIGKQESKIHGYDIGADDCFAHLEVNFEFANLTSKVSGVLGQTYQPGYKTPVKVGVPMPIMGGDLDYLASHLFVPDCPVARFGGDGTSSTNLAVVSSSCGASNEGRGGFVCRR